MTAFRTPIVLLANGLFPSHPAPLGSLASAGTVICTDGSADSLIEKGLMPHIIIGDMDSTKLAKEVYKGLIIHVPAQDNTDMAKALEWCKINGIKTLTILGATEKRDDHTLANLFLLSKFLESLNLRMVTDYFNITCHSGKRIFSSFPGQLVSLIPPAPVAAVTTEGLTFTLQNESLNPSSRGVSNKSSGDSFTVTASSKIWVFRSHPEN